MQSVLNMAVEGSRDMWILVSGKENEKIAKENILVLVAKLLIMNLLIYLRF